MCSSTVRPGERDHLRAIRSVVSGDSFEPPEPHKICTRCGKEIREGEIPAQLDGQPYHADCQSAENDRLAWSATLDGIRFGLGDAIRSLAPRNADELHKLRDTLKGDSVRPSRAFTVIATVATSLRTTLSASEMTDESKERFENNLDRISQILSSYLNGRKRERPLPKALQTVQFAGLFRTIFLTPSTLGGAACIFSL